MLSDRFFIALFGVLVLLAALHLLGLVYYWYWQIWWFDILTHFLGGFWVGGMALWIARVRNPRMHFSAVRALAIAIAAILVVGFSWEVWELYVGGTTLAYEHYASDTTADAFADLAGALGAAALFLLLGTTKTETA